MQNAVLKGVKITNVEFKNNIKTQKKIELGFSYSYNVKYSNNIKQANGNTCIGEFTAKITDKANSGEFCINVTASGVFGCKEDAKKEILHVETYNELFPHVRAFVTTLTANAGIPPIMIPFIDISKKEIYRLEMGKDGKNPSSADDFINPYDNR